VSRSPDPLGILLVAIARGWQLTFSLILPPSCRFQPSCSAYAIEAVRLHGGFRGGWLAIRRILRCHPWGGHGFDPVPEPDARTATKGHVQ
jgi:putative membrane protein insertion efficiency factor